MKTDTLFESYPDVLTARELQEALGLGRLSTYRLLSSGSIACFKIGKTYRIPKTALLNYVKTQCTIKKEADSR